MLNVNSESYKKFLKLRPLNVLHNFRESDAALVSGRDIAAVAKANDAIVMATNIRNILSAEGILAAAKEMDAFVYLELSKTENGYTGVKYDNLPKASVSISEKLGNGVVYALHMDHFAVKSSADRNEGVGIVNQAIRNGWTSLAIDASHNPDYPNFIYTRDLAHNIPSYIGLEVEVGEIKGAGVLTTVEEGEYFIGGLNSWYVFPDFLAISNGSKHGTYDKSKGDDEGIDLNRTKEVAEAVAKYGVVIAQHGISGTPFDKVGKFKNYMIHKGNVGTLWQNLVYGLEVDATGNAVIKDGTYVKDPNRGISQEIWDKMVKWADGKGFSRSDGNYKKANVEFDSMILGMDKKYKNRIVDETKEWAKKFFKEFNAEGTGSMVVEHILKRGDRDSTPQRELVAKRSDYRKENAPDGGVVSIDGKDYDD